MTSGRGGQGVGGSGVGGSGVSGGTGATTSVGGAPGVGGTAGAGASATGGAGVGGMVPIGPFACENVTPTCDSFTQFPLGEFTWGNSELYQGGFAAFGDGLTASMDASTLHVTGTVAGYGYGFNIWFSNCSDLSAFWGVAFTTTGFADTVESINFQVLTNSTFPWQFQPENENGACTGVDATNPWATCIAPLVNVHLGAAVVSWMQMQGGSPVAWDPSVSPKEVLGLQWLFPWDESRAPYAVDVALDNVAFLDGKLPSCDREGTAGAGGMGGVGGVGGISGAGGGGIGGGGVGGDTSVGGTSGASGAGTGGLAGAGGLSGAGGTDVGGSGGAAGEAGAPGAGGEGTGGTAAAGEGGVGDGVSSGG